MNGDFIEPSELHALLTGREERALLQRFCLARFEEGCLCQLALNIPGLPKKMVGDVQALSAAARRLMHALGQKTAESVVLVNGAGPVLLLVFRAASPARLKQIAIEVEESADWCRLLDIDVISENGAVSRSDLGFPPRRCLLCEEEAKLCARLGSHSIQDLREVSARLLSRSFNSATSIR